MPAPRLVRHRHGNAVSINAKIARATELFRPGGDEPA